MPENKPGNKKMASGKAGVRNYAPGENLFDENDPADSLFIIQSGQVRLFRPKGRGYIELAVLRSGEMIGEMAYFGDGQKRRSCSAAAIVNTEAIEISFQAFGKTLSELTPWLRSIIHSLVSRLKIANEKVKLLESNSVGGFKKRDGTGEYTFFHGQDIMRIFSTLYLVMKSYGEPKGAGHAVHVNRIRFFMFDVYNIQEVKYEELIRVLETEGILSVAADPKGTSKAIEVFDTERLRELMVFFNQQRMAQDKQKITISPQCQQLLEPIYRDLKERGTKDGQGEQCRYNLTPLLDALKAKNMATDADHLEDAIKSGFAEEVFISEGNLYTTINQNKLLQLFPFIRIINAIQKVNQAKLRGR